MTTEERVNKNIIFALQVKPDTILPTSKLDEDLGADSLDYVSIAMELEDEFDIVIPHADAEKFVTVQDIYDYAKLHNHE